MAPHVFEPDGVTMEEEDDRWKGKSSGNVHDWLRGRGYLHRAKFWPIGIYLADLQPAPNSRLWMLRLIREPGSDLLNFVPSVSI